MKAADKDFETALEYCFYLAIIQLGLRLTRNKRVEGC